MALAASTPPTMAPATPGRATSCPARYGPGAGVAAQDDWHRSEKDARRVQQYLPGYDSEAGGGRRVYGQDYRIYRLEGQLGPRLLYPDNLRVEMRKRGYGEQAIAKILGGNLLRVFSQVMN